MTADPREAMQALRDDLGELIDGRPDNDQVSVMALRLALDRHPVPDPPAVEPAPAPADLYEAVRELRDDLDRRMNFSWINHTLCNVLARFRPVELPDSDEWPRRPGLSFTFEDGVGLCVNTGGRGCPLWYLSAEDYQRAHDEAGSLDRAVPIAPVELPEGAIPLAPGWHLRPTGGEWEMGAPDGEELGYPSPAEWWRAAGQPVPEPAPQRVGPEGLSETETRRIATEWSDTYCEQRVHGTGSLVVAMKALARSCRHAVTEWENDQ